MTCLPPAPPTSRLTLPDSTFPSVCSVTINVPPATPPTRIAIRQSSGDTGFVAVTAREVEIKTLDIRGTGLAVDLEDVTATTKLWVSSVSAPIQVVDCKFTNVYLYANSAPVYLTRPYVPASAR